MSTSPCSRRRRDLVLATGARWTLRNVHPREAHTMMRMGLGMVAILAPLQLVAGDLHGLNTLEHQPVKIAAMEANWKSSGSTPFVIFAWPDEKTASNRFEIGIPYAGSLILTHSMEGKVPGLLDFAPEDRPPVAPVFFSFRIMLACGFLMIAIGFIGVWLWARKRLTTTRWFLKSVGHAWPLGFIAILAGWMVTEIGRQPWVAYGILRTADAVSPVAASTVATSLVLFVIVYGVVFSIGIFYIYRMLRRGLKTEPPPEQALPNRPLSAASDISEEGT